MPLPVLGDAVTMKASNATPRVRPALRWAEGLSGTIVSIPRGGRFTIPVADGDGRLRHIRVEAGDLA